MFDLNIYTPNRVIGTFKVNLVCLPGAEGMLGIGSNHAPFVSKMKPGILSFETERNEKFRYFVSGGFAQVAKNTLDVLIENAEASKDLDKARAKKAEERSLERLKHLTPDVDIPRALGALERARQRLLLVEQTDRT